MKLLSNISLGVSIFVVVIGKDANDFKDYMVLVNDQPENRFVAEIRNDLPNGFPVFESFFGRLKSEFTLSKNK